MGNEVGVNKLKSSRADYSSMANSDQSMPGVIEPNKGFEMKPGSNGKSSGSALPIYQGPSMGFQQKPESDNGPAEDNDEDEADIVEPDAGFVKEPVAGGR